MSKFSLTKDLPNTKLTIDSDNVIKQTNITKQVAVHFKIDGITDPKELQTFIRTSSILEDRFKNFDTKGTLYA